MGRLGLQGKDWSQGRKCHGRSENLKVSMQAASDVKQGKIQVDKGRKIKEPHQDLQHIKNACTCEDHCLNQPQLEMKEGA
jgi:hypothetical protein